MSVLDQVRSDTTAAMKAGDKERVGALRMIVNELQKAEKEGGGDEIAVLQRERKRRLESAEAYREAGRTDLAEGEEREAELIEATCRSSSRTRSCARSSATSWRRRERRRRRRWAR